MEDFGGRLRQARERRGISLRQIAVSTKISAAALEALERNDVSKLPGGIFSRAFVRSYAHEVGLDADQTVREFVDRFEHQPAETESVPKVVLADDEIRFDAQQRIAGVVLRLAVVSIPIVIVILYYTLRSRPAPVSQTTWPPEAATAASAAHQRLAAEPAVPVTGTPDAPTRAASVPGLAPAPGAGRDVTLDLHPTGECWVSVTVDGRKLFAKVMHAGERERLVVTREAIVDVGDAGAFAYSVNDKEGQPLGVAGQVKTLRVTPPSVPR